MIRGIVQVFPRLRLHARGSGRRYQAIEAIIDTGFDGWVSLPPRLVGHLELQLVGEGQGELADGSESLFEIYEATIRWHGRAHKIPVYAIGGIPLIGMGLLDGSELNMKVRPGGEVTIKPLRRRRAR